MEQESGSHRGFIVVWFYTTVNKHTVRTQSTTPGCSFPTPPTVCQLDRDNRFEKLCFKSVILIYLLRCSDIDACPSTQLHSVVQLNRLHPVLLCIMNPILHPNNERNRFKRHCGWFGGSRLDCQCSTVGFSHICICLQIDGKDIGKQGQNLWSTTHVCSSKTKKKKKLILWVKGHNVNA